MKNILSILVILVACYQQTNGLRILGLFPLPGKSHWVMMEELMKGLVQRGHQVDVVTHFPLKKPMPNYNEIMLKQDDEIMVNKLTADDIKKFTGSSMYYFTYMAGTKVCQLLELPVLQEIIKNPPKDPPYDLIITEMFISPCYLAFGRHLGIPLIGTITSAFPEWLNDLTGNPLNTAYMPSLFAPYDSNMNFWQRLQNTILTLSVTAQIRYFTSSQREVVKNSFGIDTSIDDLYSDVSLILLNSHHSLHGIRPFTPSIVEVAGLHISERGETLSPEIKKWLDESTDGCVFFTFGSMVRIETFPKEKVEQFYKAFENIAPVRVLMKVAKKEDLLPGLPKNVMTHHWFPQLKVLKHKNVKAFLTHGGLMGTQESIHAGVPLVGIPLFGDQPTNIMNYVRKNVAVSLGSMEDVTAEKLTSALKTVLYDQTYRESIKSLSSLFNDRPMSPLNTSIFWVEYVAKHGNVLQSPAIRLSWWQSSLLDVYGFILLCIALVLFIIVKVLCMIKRMACGGCSQKNPKASESKKKK